MKRLVSSIFLTSCLLAVANLSQYPNQNRVAAQMSRGSDLFYTFYGQQIPLNLRSDVIAVAFKPQTSSTRGVNQALHLRLQQALQGRISGTRGEAPAAAMEVEVNPLGDRYALVKLAAGTRSSSAAVTQRIQQQPYVQTTLPVLSRGKTSEASDESEKVVVLPNEIVLSFEPTVSNSERELLLMRHNLQVIRPLRFSQNRYLVQSKSVSGTAVLNVANQLNGVAGVQSATPNFVQTLSNPVREQTASNAALTETPKAIEELQALLDRFPNKIQTPYPSAMLPLQWHLDSTPRRGQSLPRTDIRATESWKESNQGKGVVVAVIDSLIQWDHPDLANNVYTVGDVADKLPGEVHGWDFSGEGEGDPDTRISQQELAIVRPNFQKTFKLSAAELLKEYEILAMQYESRNPNASPGQVANWVRNQIRNEVAAEFHGTWSAGVIAARPASDKGVIGVAPNAQILPVRVFGLGGEISPATLIEAVGYSAARNVDVINMSLGSLMPNRELTDRIFEVLDANPKLVIIASAGNDSLDGVGFPAAIPGVVSVGATNMSGNRTAYSNYGGRLDVVAPGGDIAESLNGGILTTGGTWVNGFWQGMQVPDYAWGVALDPQGKYVQVQGTSFSAPTVSGVMALMKGEDPNRRLDRDRLVAILKKTASYEGLAISKADENQYRLQSSIGFGTARDFSFLRPSGVFQQPKPVSAQQYFFGSGLVNAAAAIREVKR